MLDRNRIAGNKAESAFRDQMSAKGWTVRKADVQTDREDHVDFFLSRGAERMAVDVKACKRVAGQFRDDLVWVEVMPEHGIRSWLYAPRVTHVAFQQQNGEFLLIPRHRLVNIVKAGYNKALTLTCDINTLLSDPKRYVYRRAGSLSEQLLLVETGLFKTAPTREGILKFFNRSPRSLLY